MQPKEIFTLLSNNGTVLAMQKLIDPSQEFPDLLLH
jgi:hypothetical protein